MAINQNRTQLKSYQFKSLAQRQPEAFTSWSSRLSLLCFPRSLAIQMVGRCAVGAGGQHRQLEISEQSEIGIDDFFWIPSLRTIELALSGSSKNEAYSVKSRAKDLAKKSFSLSSCMRVRMRFSPSNTRRRCSGVTPSLLNYDQAYGRPARIGGDTTSMEAAHKCRRRWMVSSCVPLASTRRT